MPSGMVQRNISPSFPKAPHMGAAIAILNGEDIEPIDAPTAKPADSPVAEMFSNGAACT